MAKPRKPRNKQTDTAKEGSESTESVVEITDASTPDTKTETVEPTDAAPETNATSEKPEIEAAADPQDDPEIKPDGGTAKDDLAESEAKTEAEKTDEPIEALTEEPETHLDDGVKDPDPDLDVPEADDKEPETRRAAYTPNPQPEPRSSGFWPLVFGGVVAAMLGFILGRADQIDRYLPGFMQRQTADLTEIEAQTAALGTQTEALTGRTEELSAQSGAMAEQLASLSEAVAALQSAEPAAVAIDTSGMETAIADLSAKITELESRPVVAPGSPELEALVAALEATIAEQAGQIAALTEGVASVQQEEQTAAQEVLARAALSQVKAAIDTGATYAPALADLEATGLIEVPSELALTAGEGVPTMAALSAAFPEAARLALAAARSQDATSGGVDLGAFLTRQLGVRSVTPRDGDDPDAILSRAEAALRKGDLTSALTEIEALPDVSKSELSGWLEQAQTRQTALDAANSMAQSLPAN